MEIEDTLPHGRMMQCPTCPRRVFLSDGGMKVIDTGDFYASHSRPPNEKGLRMALLAEVVNE